jgi:hypothetical protein
LRSSWLPILAIVLVAGGCSTSNRFVRPADDHEFAAYAMHRYLDRWVGWKSLTTRVKLTYKSGDTTASARGHLLYLLGERFEIGFERPYDRYLGNLYVTPEKTIYWDVNSIPKVFSDNDSSTLSDVIHIPAPNWDPRDLLPFPASGRVGGLAMDSIWREGSHERVLIAGESSQHVLEISRSTGFIDKEWVMRRGREPVIKEFRKNRTMDGWPVPVKVTCTDTSGHFSLTWSLKGMTLDAEPYELPSDTLAPGISG